MSMPNIPNLEPSVTITRKDAVNIILSSIGMEELSLSHILNAEAEKIQFALGTLDPNVPPASLEDILLVNKTAGKMLRDVVKNQMLLGMKLEDVLDIDVTEPTTTTTTTTTTSTTTTTTTTTTV